MKPLIDRITFQKVRKMGYGQLTAFLNSIYLQAYKDGQKDCEGLTTADVKKVLLGINGIGEKRAGQIMEALEMKLDDEETLEWLCGECGKDLSSVKGAKFCPYCGTELNWGE